MNEIYYGYRFLLLALILGANAFFAGAEVALVSVRPSRLRELAAEGAVGAQAALSLLANPERLLSVVQVGVTLASLALGWAGEETLSRFLTGLFHPVLTPATEKAVHGLSFTLGFLVMTFFHVVIGEVVPKNLAIEKADRLAVLVAPPLLVFYRVSEPFVYVIERSAAAISRLLGLRGEPRGGGHSTEELKLIVTSSRREGGVPKFEEDAIHRLLDLQDLAVREIMVPRNDIVSVSLDASLEEIVRVMQEHQFSRVPVYEDRPEQIVGVLHYKDLLRHKDLLRLREDWFGASRPLSLKYRLRSLLRKPTFVPETKPLNQMVDEFRLSRSHMSMVVDEFGTIVGLVTLEDVLEQIFGEIEDEHDLARQLPALEAQVVQVEGTTTIRDLETQYGVELPADAGFETLAGFILYRLGRIPKQGDSVEQGGRRFTVLEMDRNRIARVRVERTGGPRPQA
jgi:CBS domain containing-hemolysin-like protein